MAAIFLLLLLITEISISTAQQNDTKISIGSSISPSTNRSYWLSNSGQFAFGFYKQGNGFAIGIWFEMIKEKTVIWTADRDQQPLPQDVTLLLNSDGRLVLQNKQGQQIPVGDFPLAAASASMLDSGNFVLYNADSKKIWQSFEHPTDTLISGQHLDTEKILVSAVSETNHSSGRFQLIMQSDGNLIQRPAISGLPYFTYWYSDTRKEGDPKIILNLTLNGQLDLLSSTSGSIVKTIHAADWRRFRNNVTYRLAIDADGILRMYSHSLVQVNSSWNIEFVTTDRCAPTGLCGMNAYCVLENEEPNCTCLPGFDFIDQRQKSLGCDRNTSIYYCTVDHHDVVSLKVFDGVVWENNSYSFVPMNNKIACEQACLKDCNCEIASFANNICNKLMFPLRHAKVDDTQSDATTIVKVLNGSSWTKEDTSSFKETKKGQALHILISGIVCLIFSVIILFFSAFLFCRSHFHSNKKVQRSDEGLLMADEVLTVRSFTFKELEFATNFFVEQLGKGSFGTVFKGKLRFPDGEKAIAVKRLEKVAVEGEVEFLNEIRSIGRTHHKNLLRLLGYCHEESNRLLVYDYMSHGSLSNFLFKSEVKPHWDERLRIALGIARGIRYLHEECENKIIHCDINPNNILIDENRCAKIADFGLAKLLMPDQTRTNTGIRGTRGFVAPEWHKNLPITTKADVYSFGIVLFVIICCRPSVDARVPEKEAILVDWVDECFRMNKLRTLFQDEEVNEQEFDRLVKIGLWCIQEDPTSRPAMKKVVSMFEGTLDIPVPPCPTSCNDSSYFLDME
ncbi:G-type lectin S-receptor-like serine/threonine-protein kinase LECRK1 [Humulus lupulus]|uniref:G-type lectin S-receptor-like serine/threonine-protein kinase LECRK1 n=1 Tax=Humulus lupulus TaxID=3486 RepID=UPI002B40C05E|nr:G-type lectin S-receptor-like serine/threonine-protein kinase LECRK1 [Humulus lupulus]